MALPGTQERDVGDDALRRGQVKASATAEIVCALRAAETCRSPARRLIDDPYARYFLTARRHRLLCSSPLVAGPARAFFDRRYPGLLSVVLLRHRWFEHQLASALEEGIMQVVLLGAGYDSTSLRTDLPGATLYEVDAPPTQQAKRRVIGMHGLRPRAEVRYIACDFERQALGDRLRRGGYDPSAPCLIGWWGVSFFLTEEAVRRTLADVASLTAPGSRLVFDYLDASVVDGTTRFPGATRARAAVAARGEPYRFGLTRSGVGDFLRPYGFVVERNLSMTELAGTLGSRGMPAFPYSTHDFFGVVTSRRAGS